MLINTLHTDSRLSNDCLLSCAFALKVGVLSAAVCMTSAARVGSYRLCRSL